MAYELIVIGTSLGGLRALEVVLSGLPGDLPIAVAIAQHRHKQSAGELVNFLQQHSQLPIVEAEDKQKIERGKVYLAPSDYHLLVESGYLALSTEGPVSYARPSIDVLFESASDAYGQRVIGVILTGANHDGAKGLAAIEAQGGYILIQEPDTAECQVMPKAAIAKVIQPYILPLVAIAPHLVHLCSSSLMRS